MHRLVALQEKLNKSGLNDNPIITDNELRELRDGLNDIASYFRDRNESLISFALTLEANSIMSVLYHREAGGYKD